MKTLSKLLKNIDRNDELEFYEMSLKLPDGSEVFTHIAEIKGSSDCIMKNPMRVYREYSGMSFRISFDMYDPFSDDTFFIIDDKDIVTMAALSPNYHKMYEDAVNTMNQMKMEAEEKKKSNEQESMDSCHTDIENLSDSNDKRTLH